MPAKRSVIGKVERQLFLRTMPIARPLGGAANWLAEQMEDAFFPAGTTIYRESEASLFLYFVVKGRVSLTTPGAEPWEFGERSVVGILDMMVDRPRSRTAVALTDVQALGLRVEDWFEMLEDNFEYTRGAVLSISGNLAEMSFDLDNAGFAGATGGQSVVPRVELAAGGALNLVQRLIVLRDVPCFVGAGIQALTSLAEQAEEERFRVGQTIYREGDETSALYVVASGQVELEREHPPRRARFGPRSLLGGHVAFTRQNGFTARAVEPSLCLRIRIEDFFDTMEIHFEVARSTMKYLALEQERIKEARTLHTTVAGKVGGVVEDMQQRAM